MVADHRQHLEQGRLSVSTPDPQHRPDSKVDLDQSRAKRADQAEQLSELREGKKRHESKAAQKLINEFLLEAERRGVEPGPLRATLLSGHSVKTDKTGWYLRKNHSLAIGIDGSYYQLTIMGGLAERLRGAKLTATPPPIYVGSGGKDGETGDLTDFLERVLNGQT